MECRHCDKIFDSIKSYVDHYYSLFSPEQIQIYICNLCSRIYSNRYKFRDHLKIHESKTLKNYTPIYIADQTSIIEANNSNLEKSPYPKIITKTPQDEYKLSLIKIILKYISKKSNTRKVVIDFSGEMLFFVNGILETIFADLESTNTTLNNNLYNLRNFLDTSKNLSEHKFCMELERLNVWTPFKEIVFEEKKSLALLNIKYFFSKLFENEKFSYQVLQYLETLNSNKDYFSNIVQSEFWQSILEANPDENTLFLPLLFYNDDFEGLNALGAHATAYSINGSYVKIGLLPSSLNSKIAFIFPIAFCHAKDITEFSVNRVFFEVVALLNSLFTDGIDVKFGHYTKVKFVTTNILADNKGYSSILNFVSNFSTTSYFCRFCKHDKNELKKIHKIDANKLRTKESYESDLKTNNYKLTGIKGETIFSHLENFDVIENSVVDYMHDVAEGVVKYDICQIISAFITKKYFSLEFLNEQLRNFKYDPDQKNRPDNITRDNLKHNSLKFSASEALVFSQHLNVMIGNKIPEDDEHWQLYILLRKILKILNLRSIDSSTALIFSQITSEHNQLYVKLFGSTLKYKLHLLLHYSNIMRRFGPLNQFSNFRFESKHSEFVKTIQSSCNRKNIPKTLAIKSQFQFANLLLNFEYNNDIEIQGEEKLDKSQFLKMNLKFNFDLFSEDNSISLKKIITDGKCIKTGNIFELLSSDEFLFGRVVHIIGKNTEYFLLYKLLIYPKFDFHFDCFTYEGEESEVFLANFNDINISNVAFPFEVDGNLYFNIM